jgi:aldose 1-epimerase
MTIYPSGNQYQIDFQDQSATIVEVGGGIREYRVGQREVLESYPVEAMCDGAHGTPLMPWPNRLEDGKYSFDGNQYQVDITEPAKNNAIHGFLRWQAWNLIEQTDNHLTMAIRIHPRSGYPFTLEISVTYSLSDEGLTVAIKAENLGKTACPFGAGQHPYLSPGNGLIDDCVVTLDADTRILTDNPRQLPRGSEPVFGSEFDFREGKKLNQQSLDYPFTDLARDRDGKAWIKLLGPDGHSAEIWVDESYKLIEMYTGDTLSPSRRRHGLGAEPMTCPPNAFKSGEDLVRLNPGDTFTGKWGAKLAKPF